MLKWFIINEELTLFDVLSAPFEHKCHTLLKELWLLRHQATRCVFKMENVSCIRKGVLLSAENDNNSDTQIKGVNLRMMWIGLRLTEKEEEIKWAKQRITKDKT